MGWEMISPRGMRILGQSVQINRQHEPPLTVVNSLRGGGGRNNSECLVGLDIFRLVSLNGCICPYLQRGMVKVKPDSCTRTLLYRQTPEGSGRSGDPIFVQNPSVRLEH